MKIYGVNLDGKSRGIVAAESKSKAAKLFNMSMYHFRDYGCETGNKEEIELALKEPYVVWKKAYNSDAPWIRVMPKD